LPERSFKFSIEEDSPPESSVWEDLAVAIQKLAGEPMVEGSPEKRMSPDGPPRGVRCWREGLCRLPGQDEADGSSRVSAEKTAAARPPAHSANTTGGSAGPSSSGGTGRIASVISEVPCIVHWSSFPLQAAPKYTVSIPPPAFQCVAPLMSKFVLCSFIKTFDLEPD